MLVLTMRTDKPEAEVGLYDDTRQISYAVWTAHRQLAETLHARIASLLESENKQWSDIAGIVAYEGPGSFTGLRIGLSVANTIAYSNDAQIIATTGEAWIHEGITSLMNEKGTAVALPEYGAPVHITTPKK